METRDITGSPILENNESTGSENLVGRWVPFNAPSVQLRTVKMERGKPKVIAFREIITPTAFDRVSWDDTLCVSNHDEITGYIARYGSSMDITKGDDGMYYRASIMPEDPLAVKVKGYVTRGDYKGNSFRFTVADKGDIWERQADGSYIRYVNEVSQVFHVGPVFRPAYNDTNVSISSRSLEELEEDAKGLLLDLEERKQMNLRLLDRKAKFYKVFSTQQ